MFDPLEVNRIGGIYVEERVLDAKNNHIARKNGNHKTNLLQQAGDFLIATGQKLKGHPQSAVMSLTVAEK